MGWKRIKDHFRIEHIVRVREGRVLIGSPYVPDLLTILPDGRVQKGPLGISGNRELGRYWDDLSADPALVASLLAEPDVFARSITVYGYDGAKIIEKQCEEPGYPNVTHDGELMYDNSFWTSRDEAVRAAQENAAAAVRWRTDDIARREKELDERRADLREVEAVLAETKTLKHRQPLPSGGSK